MVMIVLELCQTCCTHLTFILITIPLTHNNHTTQNILHSLFLLCFFFFVVVLFLLLLSLLFCFLFCFSFHFPLLVFFFFLFASFARIVCVAHILRASGRLSLYILPFPAAMKLELALLSINTQFTHRYYTYGSLLHFRLVSYLPDAMHA